LYPTVGSFVLAGGNLVTIRQEKWACTEVRGLSDFSLVGSLTGDAEQFATSMFPFALNVSDCDFSEAVDATVHDRIEIC
jgi:hypothetical protein